MMGRIFRIFHLLLPPALFVVVLLKVRSMFDTGDARTGIILMLGALVVLTVWEGVLIRYRVLPAWGRTLGERIYVGSYTPDDDPLVALATRIRREHAPELLPQLEALARQDAARVRSWTELAALQQEEAGNLKAALSALLEGAERVSDRQDRAMLLYRAAHLCSERMADKAQARELLSRAASRYPSTVYGSKAGRELSSS